MQRLYGHDPELHHLMTAVTLLRDETAVLRQEMAVYAESGPELSAKAGEAYAEELQALGRRATDKGVLLPEEPSAAADMLGDVLSIEDLVADLGVAEQKAADVSKRFADDVVEVRSRLHRGSHSGADVSRACRSSSACMTRWSACSACASSPRATVRGLTKLPSTASCELNGCGCHSARAGVRCGAEAGASAAEAAGAQRGGAQLAAQPAQGGYPAPGVMHAPADSVQLH